MKRRSLSGHSGSSTPRRKTRYSNDSSTSYSSTSTPSTNKTKSNKSTSSKRNYHCEGCNKSFTNFNSVSEFLNNHMKVSSKCRKAIFTCNKCKKCFINEKGFMSHLTRSNKECLKFHSKAALAKAKVESFSKSQVNIPDLKNQRYVQRSNIHHNNQSSFRFLTSSVQKFSFSNFKHTNSSKTNNTSESTLLCMPTSENSLICSNNQGSFSNINKPNINSDFVSNTNNILIDFEDDNDNGCVIDDNQTSFIGQVIEDNTTSNLFNDIPSFTDSNNDLNISNNTTSSTNVINNNHHLLIPKQSHLNILDVNHFLTMKESQRNEISSLDSDTQYREALELIQLLMLKKMPMSAYADFMKWRYKDEKNLYYSYEELTKLTEKRVYGEVLASKLCPKDKNISCPSGRKVNIITYDIDAAIYDLLSDRNLTQPQNMIFDGTEDDPFLLKDKDIYDDLDQSGVYQETYKAKISDPNSELLVPLIIYMDETNLDTYSKLVLHPIVITLGIYNRSTRHLSMSWRTIGYLPNFDESFGNKKYSADDKLSDFHYCLRYIIDGIEQMQSFDHFNWTFEFPGYERKFFKRKMKFFLSHVVSDAKENDMICGRMSNRSSTIRLCRDCDIKIEDSDNPQIKCNFHKMTDLEKLNKEELQLLSFKKVMPYLAFSNIDMGANIYGINGCTPSEPLHQINGGICERLPVTFMNRLSVNQVKVLDSHVAFTCTHFSRQSDRSIYDIKPFRNGVSSVSKLSATEKVSRVLAIFLTLISSDFEKEIIGKNGRRNDDNSSSPVITKEEYNLWIKVFEDTLILTSWVYYTGHPKSVFKGGRNSVAAQALKKFIEDYKKIADRKEGMGNKYLKFHQILHLWIIIRLFSSLPNIDSGRNESHHKKKKEIATHTQRRIESFDQQTAKKEYKYDLFLKAMKKASMYIPEKFEMKNEEQQSNLKKTIDESQIIGSHASKYLLVFDYDRKSIEVKYLSKKITKKVCYFPQHILDAVFTKFEGYNHGKVGYRIQSIIAFSECKCFHGDDISIIRACPDYRSERDWFDWALINWGDSEIEAQVLLFLDFNTINLEENTSNTLNNPGMDEDHRTIKDQYVAIIHSCMSSSSVSYRKPIDASMTNGFITNRLCSYKRMEDTYQHVAVDTILRPTAVYVDKAVNGFSLFTPGTASHVYCLESKSSWHNHFIDYTDKDLLEEASKRVDEDYDSDNKRYVFEG